jgi:hypothetical protein|tara:strand:- start:662 stop:958 length:297 start_codon:yes stop_codon:yes gene_type:complete
MKKPVRQHGSSEIDLKDRIAQALAKQKEERLKHEALDIDLDPTTPIPNPKVIFQNEESMWRELAVVCALQTLAEDENRWNYGLNAKEQLIIWQPWTVK